MASPEDKPAEKSESEHSTPRRGFLAGVVATGITAIAGCADDEGGGDGTTPGDDTTNGETTTPPDNETTTPPDDEESEVEASFMADPASGDAPLEVEFDASGSMATGTEISSYEWDFGDDNTGSGEAVSHTFEEAGEYEVELTVTGEDDTSDTQSTTITVEESGPIGGDAEIVTEADPDADADVSIAQVEGVPMIDGSVSGVWEDLDAHVLEHVPEGDPSEENLSAEWRGAWSEDALYVHVDVTDDELVFDEGDEPWQNDSPEVYVDTDNSKDSSYGDNDAQLTFLPDGGISGSGTDGFPTDEVEWRWTETENGYGVSAQIPWAGAGPAETDMIGLDVHINDSDGGGDRDNKVAWHDDTQSAWSDPSVFGDAHLSGA